MKKILTLLSICAISFTASAEGYQVNTFSAKQEGMGHAGVAMKLGAESQIFNPAAVVFMDKTMEISGSVSAISATAKAWINGNEYESNNKVSTPLNISAAFRIYDNLYAGLTFYTPYGSSINWGKNWPAAVLNQSVDLKVFSVQPTFSWRLLPNLSIGAGLMIAWGNVNLNKGLVSAYSFDQVLALQAAAAKLQAIANPSAGIQVPNYPPFGEVSPASANLVGSSKLAMGVNVGAMWDINEKFTVGASFRSKLNMHVEAGDVTVEYANELAAAVLKEQINNLNYTNFEASMPCPYVLTAGVAYKPIPRLTIAFDAQLNGWGTYKQLDITFAEQPQFDQHLTKDYHNAMTYHLGAQFEMTERLDLRAGLMVDTNPCNTDYYNPETPGTTKWEPSVGLSFRPIKGLSIDLAFMYVYGQRVNNATGRFDDFLATSFNEGLASYNAALASPVAPGVTLGQYLAASGNAMPEFEQLPKTGTIKGDFQVRALVPAIGISYSF